MLAPCAAPAPRAPCAPRTARRTPRHAPVVAAVVAAREALRGGRCLRRAGDSLAALLRAYPAPLD